MPKAAYDRMHSGHTMSVLLMVTDIEKIGSSEYAIDRNLSRFVWMPPRSDRTHDLVIGLFINRYEFGRLL
jgi:hypothetical protein